MDPFRRPAPRIRPACLLAALVLLLAAAAATPPARAGEAGPDVLVLHSYHKGFRWTDNIMAGIDAVFESRAPQAKLHVEYMDTKIFAPETMFPALLDLYRHKYAGVRFDAVIATDDNALNFLLLHRDKLFPDTPVVFCGINNLAQYRMEDYPGYTGVAEDSDLAGTIELALSLHPQAKRVVSISDLTPSSRANLEHFRQLAPRFKGRAEFVELARLTVEDLLEALRALPPDSVILHQNFFRDPTGRTFSYQESIHLVADNCNIPIYVGEDWALGHGVVGGHITSGKLQGETAASMALRLLAGEPIQDVPIAWESPKQYLFDYAQLKRFNIGLGSLPKGSVVLDKPRTFYFRYKRYIWTAAGAFVLLAGIIVALLVNIERRRRTENELMAIFDNSLVGILFLKGSRYIAKANKRVTDILGYSPAELAGQDAVVLHESRDNYMDFGENYYEKLAGSELIHVEYPLRRKDGRTIWCLLSGKALYPPNLAKGVIWVIDDITERKRAQEALEEARTQLEQRVEERTAELSDANEQLRMRMAEINRAEKLLLESEKKYRENLEAVFGSLPDAIVTVDASMLVLEANKSFEKIAQASRAKLLGRTLERVLPPQHLPCLEALRHTLATREPVRDRRVHCAGDGMPHQVAALSTAPYLDPQGRFAGAVMVIRDITRLVELERQLEERHRFRNIIGQSKPMQELYAALENLSDYDATVLILGESGTGKELVAEALHFGGPNPGKPFVKVNCSALTESLLESELFGHVKGAFTGAYKDKVGRFEAAEGGTVFLDEIGDISPRIQLKLLRFLEQKEFERVGESRTKKANVRVIAATNNDLPDKVRTGAFREDLFYRLKVVVVDLPPLRDRTEDIPLLVQHFVGLFGERLGKDITSIDDRAMDALRRHRWPGNVRELKHAVEHACIVCPDRTITLEHLPPDLRLAEAATARRSPEPLAAMSQDNVMQALRQARWNKTLAAKLLGISRRHLYRKLNQYDIN